MGPQQDRSSEHGGLPSAAGLTPPPPPSSASTCQSRCYERTRRRRARHFCFSSSCPNTVSDRSVTTKGDQSFVAALLSPGCLPSLHPLLLRNHRPRIGEQQITLRVHTHSRTTHVSHHVHKTHMCAPHTRTHTHTPVYRYRCTNTQTRTCTHSRPWPALISACRSQSLNSPTFIKFPLSCSHSTRWESQDLQRVRIRSSHP